MSKQKQGKRLLMDQEQVAIIGMACVFPKAPNLQSYWQNIVNKVDAIGDPPEDRRIDEFYDPNPEETYKTYCARGGYLEEIPPFKPYDFGIMPVSIDGAEPEHFLALQVAHDALLDAGFLEKPFNRERVEVILGRGTYVSRGLVTVLHHGFSIHQTLQILKELHPEYTPEQLESIKERLRSSIPPFTPETSPGLVPSVMAGLVANRLDLRGANYVVDAACASALVAAENGVQDLLSGKCDVVLTGAVQTSASALMNILFTQFGALTRQSELHPFGADADGTMIGEGIGMMVLKRLSDAVREGHRIYAVIKGVGSSSDGKAKGILAPRLEGEILALERAYEAAKVDPKTVGLIEGHGTAIPLGDATELEAHQKFFGSGDGGPTRHALGTVKSMIGHLLPAAGIAGMIKTALALYHKTLPPTLHCDPPHPDLVQGKTSFYLNTETRPWIHGDSRTPRRAGVNAFGFGGINAHAVLEEVTGTEETEERTFFEKWDTELCVLQAENREMLMKEVQALVGFLLECPNTNLLDMAYTLNTRPLDQPFRLAVVATSIEETVKKLKHALKRLRDSQCRRIKDKSGIYYFEQPLAKEGRLVFLFPGEGSQYPNMLADLCLHFPEIRSCFDELDRAFIGDSRKLLPSHRIFPLKEFQSPETLVQKGIWDMDYAVDAVLTADKALFEFFKRLAIYPDVIVGHSSGEIMALEAAGAIRLSGEEERRGYTLDGNKMIRGFFTEKAIPEAYLIAAGGIDQETAIKATKEFEGEVYIAMQNCPHQIVLCARKEHMDLVVQRLRSAGALCQILPFSRPYHTPLFEPSRKSLEAFFSSVELRPPKVEMYSCMTAKPMPPDHVEIRRLAAEQWAKPVRFQETVESMYESGVRIFVEIGPRSNLTSFVQDTLKKKFHLSVASNAHHRSGMTQLNHCLGLLAAHGVSMQLAPLYARRTTRKLDFEKTGDSGTRQEPAKGAVELSIGLPLISLEGDTSLVDEIDRPSGDSAEVHKPVDRIPATTEIMGDLKSKLRFYPSEAVEIPVVQMESSGIQTNSRNPHASEVMQDHFETMERFLETQEEVMNAYLSGSEYQAKDHSGQEASGPLPFNSNFHKRSTHEVHMSEVQSYTGLAEDQTIETKVSVSPEATDSIGPAIDMATAGDSNGSVETILFALVSERTGYPSDILSRDQNLEVDLGIDSIKRVEIFGAMAKYFDLNEDQGMEPLTSLKTLGDIINYLEGTRKNAAHSEKLLAQVNRDNYGQTMSDPAPAQRGISAMPFQGRILDVIPGQEITVRRELDIEQDRFLQDHTLGGKISQEDQHLIALSVLPFTMSLEIMAEVGSRIFPNNMSLVSMKELRTHHWITIERQKLLLEIHAKALPGIHQARVELRVVDSSEENSQPAVEGLFVFGDGIPVAPSIDAFDLEQESSCSIPPEQFYPSVLYHGPSLKCVTSMNRCWKNGSEASLRLPSEEMLFRHITKPRLLSDPVLLDGAGQAIGIWAAHTLKTDFVVFPVGMEEVRFYSGASEKSGGVTSYARSSLQGETNIRSDVYLINPDGTLRVQVKGLRHKRIHMPNKFHVFRGSRESMLSSQWNIPLDVQDPSINMVCCRFDPAGMDFKGTDGQVMRTVLAYIVLNRRERVEWIRLQRTSKRGTEWLLGRVAAKEAVRVLLKRDLGLDVWPADIEIFKDNSGRPMVDGNWIGQAGVPPALSISHSRGKAVALAATGSDGFGVGIDMEHFNSAGIDFGKLAFTKQEQDMISSFGGKDSAEWTFRTWCAKEAIGKAMGRGILNGLRDLFLTNLDTQTERMEFEVKGELAKAFPGLKGTTLTAHTFRENEYIYAISSYRSGEK